MIDRLPLKEYKADRKFLATMLTRSACALLFGVTKMTISYMERDGYLHPNSDGQVSLRDAVQSWTNYLKHQRTSERAADDKEMRNLKLNEMKMRLERQKGGLVPLDWVKDSDIMLAGALNQKYQSLPARFTRDLKERHRLQGMIDEIHTDFVCYIQGLAGPDGRLDERVFNPGAAGTGRVGKKSPRVSRNGRRARAT